MHSKKIARLSIGALALALTGAIGSSAHGALALTQLWRIDAGGATWFANDNNTRGLAYNPVTNHVLVVSRTGSNQVRVLNADTGVDTGVTLDLTGVSGGTFVLSNIGVGTDGAIYAANLTTNMTTSALKIYRWANEGAAPTVAYSGDLSGGLSLRAGDDMDVRGSGTNTQIIFGLNTGSGVAANANRIGILTTADGSTFSGTSVQYTGQAAGFSRLGITFGGGTDIYGTGGGTKLVKQDGTTVQTYTSADTLNIGPIGADPGLNVMVGVKYGSSTDTSNIIRLFDVSNQAAAPVLLDAVTLPTTTVNGNGAGAVDFDLGRYRVFAVNTNNAIVAYAIPEPASLSLVGIATVGLAARRRRA